MGELRTIVFLALLGSGLFTATAEGVTLRIAEGSRIELDGTTNIGGWSCSGASIEGRLTAGVGWIEVNRFLETLESREVDDPRWTPREETRPEFSFTIPVSRLECGNRAMESDLREALRYPKHEVIRFEYASVREMRIIGPDRAGSSSFQLQVEGFLTLAGERRAIVLDVSAARTGEKMFQATGRFRLRMTSFDVTPPVALFGLIRANDQLEVTFELDLRE